MRSLNAITNDWFTSSEKIVALTEQANRTPSIARKAELAGQVFQEHLNYKRLEEEYLFAADVERILKGRLDMARRLLEQITDTNAAEQFRKSLPGYAATNDHPFAHIEDDNILPVILAWQLGPQLVEGIRQIKLELTELKGE